MSSHKSLLEHHEGRLNLSSPKQLADDSLSSARRETGLTSGVHGTSSPYARVVKTPDTLLQRPSFVLAFINLIFVYVRDEEQIECPLRYA